MADNPYKFQLVSPVVADEEIVIGQVDEELARVRASLVRRRFFASLRSELLAYPQIKQLRFNVAAHLIDFISPDPLPEGWDQVVRENTRPRGEAEQHWMCFHRSMDATRKAVGSSMDSMYALQTCLPKEPDPTCLSLPRTFAVTLTRAQVLAVCKLFVERDLVVFDRATLQEIDLQHAVPLAPQAPRPRI